MKCMLKLGVKWQVEMHTLIKEIKHEPDGADGMQFESRCINVTVQHRSWRFHEIR